MTLADIFAPALAPTKGRKVELLKARRFTPEQRAASRRASVRRYNKLNRMAINAANRARRRAKVAA